MDSAKKPFLLIPMNWPYFSQLVNKPRWQK